MYEGIDDLFTSYEQEYGVSFNTINLQRAIAVVDKIGDGYYATTIFAFENAESLLGGYLYFPTAWNEDTDWSVTDDNYWTTIAYLNGETNGTEIVFDNLEVMNVVDKAGFYTYSIDPSTGNWTITDANSKSVVLRNNDTFRALDSEYNSVVIVDGKPYTLPSDTVVVDVTDPEKDDAIMSVADLWARVLDGEAWTATFIPTSSNGINLLYVFESE